MTSVAKVKPFAPFEWMLAARYLKSRRREASLSAIAILSFLGIMLGVAALIIVMAVMNGFRTKLIEKIVGINGHIIVQAIDSPFTDYESIVARIKQVEDVTHVMPMVDGQVLASGPAGSFGGVLRGVSGADLEQLPLLASNIRQGTLDGFDEAGGIAIGTRLAENLGVGLGDRVMLISPKTNVTALGTVPRSKSYTVNAIFEIGMSQYDSVLIFLPLKEAQRYLSTNDIAGSIEVFVTDPDGVGPIKDHVLNAAARPAIITDWRQRDITFFSGLEVERNVMFIILSLVVLVAALNIISGMIMLVKDKKHDIAILRTMGATRGSILRVFFMTGAAISVVGTIAGFLLGLLVCLNIEEIRQFVSWLTTTELFSPELYYLSKLPADMETGETVSVLIMALALSFAATLYPAWRAAKLDPVDALRYD